jgi:hypothetical protein
VAYLFESSMYSLLPHLRNNATAPLYILPPGCVVLQIAEKICGDCESALLARVCGMVKVALSLRTLPWSHSLGQGR